ncbi:MAG TPA: hypothetical protein VM163_02600 [bacterium]|nr:hypothetical protein [bacterium]
MQNRFCCDQGDFGKYGLLRCLCAADAHGEALRLGMMWYLVPDEAGMDGKFTTFLVDDPKLADHTTSNRREYRACDPDLWDCLNWHLHPDRRNIEAIQEAAILPAETVYFEEPLKWPNDMPANSDAGRQRRREHRHAWWQRGFDRMKGCQVINFDPDNGLEVSVPRYGKKGPKYTFIDEVAAFYERGQSLVVYQHINFSKPATEQVEDRLKQLREATGAGSVFALRYHRGTARAYLVIPFAKHAKTLQVRAREMCKGPWARHFDLTELT